MARIAPLAPADLPGELKPAFAAAEALHGFLPNDALTMARLPGVLSAVGGLIGAIYGAGTVDAGLKRLVGEAVSKAAGCRYCQAHALHGAARQGVTAEKLDALWTNLDGPLFTPAERAAIRLALAAGQCPNAVEDGDVAALRPHFSEAEILEIVSVIALFGFLNRWNQTLATDLEAPPLTTAAAHARAAD